jgi:translation elongation factor EF-G
MYIVINKKTNEVLWKNPAPLEQNLTPKEVWAKFDPDSMLIVKYTGQNIPEYWKVDKDSNIIELTQEEKISSGVIKLEDIKQQAKAYYSGFSLYLRQQILPDYKLINCALNIYDTKTSTDIKNTVNLFREEYYRLEKLIDNATTINELNSLKENFPRLQS